MEKERKFLELALSDLKAANILYENKFYPQALYFFHQSLEKVHKAALLRWGFIKEGHEIGHKLNLSMAKLFEINARREIQQVLDRLDKKEKKGIEKDAFLIKKFMSPVKFKKLGQFVFSWKFSKAIRFKKSNLKSLNKTLAILDKKYNKMAREKRKFLIDLQEHESAMKKAALNPKVLKKLYIAFWEDYLKFNDIQNDYKFSVMFYWTPLLPDSNCLRYPEYDPLIQYGTSCPLIKVFSKLSKHLENTIECFNIHNEFINSISKLKIKSNSN